MQNKLNDVKKEVRSVLITYHRGVLFDEFLKTYRTLLGQKLPSRALGFSSDIDFLRAIPDVVHLSTNETGKILLTGIADETSQHIQRLVSKQRKSKSNSKSNKPASRNRLYRDFNIRNSTQFVPGVVRADIIQLASMYPDGLALPAFVLAYRNKFNKYLFLQRGLETLENMVKAIPDLEIRTIRNEKKIYMKSVQNGNLLKESNKVLKDSVCKLQEEGDRRQLGEKSNNSTNFDKSGVSEAVQNNFRLVLSKCPEGILAPHFPPLYENITRQTFDLFELGYNSILDLIDALPWIFQRVLDPSDDKNWIILSAKASTKHIRDKRRSKSELLTSSVSSQKESLPVKVCEGIPPGAASPFMPYVQPVMPENINLDEYLPIFVSAIVNPSLFWFQLQTDEEIKKFEILERDLGFFYGKYNNYKMSDAHIVPGASCVFRCPEDQQWYRAVIQSIPTADLINVLYLDYGSRENVSRNDLRYARSKYMEYPAHAFKARLAGLKPPNNDASWDTRSQQRFIELCESASLMAYLKPMDNDGYSTYLCDTGGEEDIHVDETLVNEGYAEFSFKGEFLKNGFDEFTNSVASCEIHSDTELYSTLKSSPQLSLLDKTNVDSAANKEYSLEGPTQGNVKTDLCGLPVSRKLYYSAEDFHASVNTFELCYDSRNRSNIKFLNIVLDFLERERHCNNVESEVTNLLKEHPIRYIKLSQINDGWKIHIFNFKNKPYASALEVTKLLWKDKDSTYLAERCSYIVNIVFEKAWEPPDFLNLLYKEIDVPTVKVLKEDYPELFKQCEWFKLPDLELNSELLTLYPLTWAFNIFNIFGHSSTSLRIILKYEIEHFDSHDSIWKEFCYKNLDVEKETEVKLSNLCLYDLKTKYEALKIKRLKLDKASNANAIDEIQKAQQLQNIIEKRMKFIEATCSLYPNYS